MAVILRKNFAASTLQVGISTGDTTIVLAPGSGANFPSATTGVSFFWATIRTSDSVKKEVVKVTNVSGDILTVVRAQQDTLAQSFSSSDIIEHNITASEVPAQELDPTSNPTFNSVVLDSTPTGTETLAEGQIAYNSTEKTVEVGVGFGLKLQVGQEQYIRVKNITGSTIPVGSVVFVNGSSGNRPTISLAKADLITTSESTIGLASDDILHNNEGFITIAGVVTDIDTTAFNEGDTLYLSASTFGALTATKPTGNFVVKLGVVLKDHATLGEILVTVNNNSVAKELTDNLAVSVNNGGTSAGRVQLQGAANRVTGDFSNATLNDRAFFKTSITNGPTAVGAVPNGTSQISNFIVFNAETPTNASWGTLQVNASEVNVQSGKSGTGTYLPLKVYANNAVQSTWAADGSISFKSGGATSKNFGSNATGTLELRQHNAFLTNAGVVFASNSYYDGTNYKAAQTGIGSIYVINNSGVGNHTWYNMASVAADANQTLTQTLVLDASGNLTATGNVTAYSDVRLKKDFEKISGALNKVKALAGYTYTRVDTEERHVGLVAQEVREVLPEAVKEDQDGKLSLAYGNMVALLVEAIKELDDKIESIRTKVY